MFRAILRSSPYFPLLNSNVWRRNAKSAYLSTSTVRKGDKGTFWLSWQRIASTLKSNPWLGAHNQPFLSSSLPLVEQPFGIELCSNVARLLSANGVENLLWGSHLMATYNVRVANVDLSFVIPKRQFPIAIKSLEAEGVPLCQDRSCEQTCWVEARRQYYSDQQPAHFHLNSSEGMLAGPRWNTVQLHAGEDVLWEVPTEGRGVAFSNGVDIIFANDPAVPLGTSPEEWGRFPASCPGVRLPTLQRYIEALVLLFLSSDGHLYSYWSDVLGAVTEVSIPDRFSHPAFTKLLKGLYGGSDRPSRLYIAEARESLRSRLHPRQTT
ncbi:hypothetical protein GQ44DRAFT_718204 [Phaeosphaeriaceae sp. PMI808]|nr:hypothetical protein GQ44DRAFT_718204 [Phaeosphaeriaceae sp. PMI808]